MCHMRDIDFDKKYSLIIFDVSYVISINVCYNNNENS